MNYLTIEKPNIAHLHVFGCKCFVLNNGKESLGKFDAKADEGIFLGYSLHSEAFRIYNKRTMTIEESIHVSFDETNITSSRKEFLDDIAYSLEDMRNQERNLKRKRNEENKDVQDDIAQENDDLPKKWKTSRNHPLDNIIGDISKGVTTRHSLKDLCNNMAFVSLIERPKNFKEAIIDDYWIIAMQEELNQFEKNNVWELSYPNFIRGPSVVGMRPSFDHFEVFGTHR